MFSNFELSISRISINSASFSFDLSLIILILFYIYSLDCEDLILFDCEFVVSNRLINATSLDSYNINNFKINIYLLLTV